MKAISVICAAVLVLSGVACGSQAQTQEELQALVQQANSAFTSADWKASEELYGKITAARPNAAAAWYRLGYARHSLGKYEQAIEAHQQASQNPATANRSFYNWACSLARLERNDAALDQLENAVQAGYVSATSIAEDADFATLKELDRFQDIAERVQAPIPDSKFREFDFWIGEWDVFGPGGTKVGSNVITPGEGGMVLIENWVNTAGTTGMSINYFDLQDRKWKQTWVDQGATTNYVGELVDGVMRFEGTHAAKNGALTKMIMEFTPNEDGSVRQYIRQSTDGGETWTVYFDGKYVKRESQ